MLVRLARYSVCVSLLALTILAAAQDPQLVIGKIIPLTIPFSIHVNPDSTTGGETVQCTVTLNQVVEGQDQVVDMETDHPEVFSNFPSSVVVPVGYDSVTFELETVTVSGSVQASIVASCNGGQATGTLTVNP